MLVTMQARWCICSETVQLVFAAGSKSASLFLQVLYTIGCNVYSYTWLQQVASYTNLLSSARFTVACALCFSCSFWACIDKVNKHISPTAKKNMKKENNNNNNKTKLSCPVLHAYSCLRFLPFPILEGSRIYEGHPILQNLHYKHDDTIVNQAHLFSLFQLLSLQLFILFLTFSPLVFFMLLLEVYMDHNQ